MLRKLNIQRNKSDSSLGSPRPDRFRTTSDTDLFNANFAITKLTIDEIVCIIGKTAPLGASHSCIGAQADCINTLLEWKESNPNDAFFIKGTEMIPLVQNIAKYAGAIANNPSSPLHKVRKSTSDLIDTPSDMLKQTVEELGKGAGRQKALLAIYEQKLRSESPNLS